MICLIIHFALRYQVPCNKDAGGRWGGGTDHFCVLAVNLCTCRFLLSFGIQKTQYFIMILLHTLVLFDTHSCPITFLYFKHYIFVKEKQYYGRSIRTGDKRGGECKGLQLKCAGYWIHREHTSCWIYLFLLRLGSEMVTTDMISNESLYKLQLRSVILWTKMRCFQWTYCSLFTQNQWCHGLHECIQTTPFFLVCFSV